MRNARKVLLREHKNSKRKDEDNNVVKRDDDNTMEQSQASMNALDSIENFDLLFGYEGVDSEHLDGDADNNGDDDPMLLQNYFNQLHTVVATFESNEDISDVWADLFFDRADGTRGEIGQVQIRQVEGSDTQYEAYLVFTQISSIAYVAPDGIFNATLYLHHGFERIGYDFEMINGEPTVFIPIIAESNLDIDVDSEAPNFSDIIVFDNDIADFESIHEIIDGDSTQFAFATENDQSGINAPRVISAESNQEINSEFYSFEIVDGSAVFKFTELGISELGLDSVDEGQQIKFFVLFKVIDESGRISPQHSIVVTVKDGGTENNNGNNSPVILDSEIDEDGLEGNDSSLIAIDANEFEFHFTLTNGIQDENPDTVTVDQSWRNEPTLTFYDEEGNAGEQYAMGQGQFVMEVINGQVEFFFTEEGIDLFDLNNSNFEGTKSFEISFRVIDEQGNLSDTHNINLHINGVSEDNFDGTNNLVSDEINLEVEDVNIETSFRFESNTDTDFNDNNEATDVQIEDVFSFSDNEIVVDKDMLSLANINNIQIEVGKGAIDYSPNFDNDSDIESLNIFSDDVIM